MTILCYLMICLIATEAAPAETANGDNGATQTRPSDHCAPCISDTEGMKHEMKKYIRHQEKMIIDTVIKNVTEITTEEMKLLERALPDIRDSFNHSLQQLTKRVNTLEDTIHHNSCKC